MYGHPADDEYAHQCLRLWGQKNRAGGPKGYPKQAAFVPRARGMDVDWEDHTVEVVGIVVSQLTEEHRALVCSYYQPDTSGKQCNVRAVCKRFGIHRQKLFEARDRCLGRVAMALSYPSLIVDEKKTLQMCAN